VRIPWRKQVTETAAAMMFVRETLRLFVDWAAGRLAPPSA
jgi:hypothetical protein